MNQLERLTGRPIRKHCIHLNLRYKTWHVKLFCYRWYNMQQLMILCHANVGMLRGFGWGTLAQIISKQELMKWGNFEGIYMAPDPDIPQPWDDNMQWWADNDKAFPPAWLPIVQQGDWLRKEVVICVLIASWLGRLSVVSILESENTHSVTYLYTETKHLKITENNRLSIFFCLNQVANVVDSGLNSPHKKGSSNEPTH